MKEGKPMKTVWRLLMTDEPDHPDAAVVWATGHRRVAIGWGEIGDLRSFGGSGEIAEAIRRRNETHPDHTGHGAANVQHGIDSLYDFCYRMTPGDLVILSIGGGNRRLVMEVTGAYEYVAPSQAPVNYQHQRKARIVDMDPDGLWEAAGGRALQGQINHRTLLQCADYIDEATLAGVGVHQDLHVGE
jgi:hypothetical protein